MKNSENSARKFRPLHKRGVSFLKRKLAYLFWGRKFGEFGSKSYIEKPLFLTGQQAIEINSDVMIWRFARIEAIDPIPGKINIRIGKGTKIHPFVHIGACEYVQIGEDCLFASNVYITDHDHDWSDPNIPPAKNQNLISDPVIIGNGVWLGERVSILKGVTIGDSTVVGAGSIVTQDLPARCVAVGAPARIKKVWNDTIEQWENYE